MSCAGGENGCTAIATLEVHYRWPFDTPTTPDARAHLCQRHFYAFHNLRRREGTMILVKVVRLPR